MTLARFFVLTIVALSTTARASTTVTDHQELAFDRPESWAMKYFASASLMTGMGPPRALHLGSIRVAFDAEWIPAVSDEQRVVGFNGSKSEDLNKLPAIGHLRLQIGLGWKLSLTLSYLPPIPIAGVEPNLLSLSLGRPFDVGHGFTVGALVYGQVGTVEGSFTCSDAEVRAGTNTQLNPIGCDATSHDHVWLNYFGGEVSASYRIRPARDLEPYVSAAVNYMNLGLEVNAHYGDIVDFTHLSTQGATFSMTGGLLYPITPRLDVGTELFYSPLTVRRPQNNNETTVEGLFNVRGIVAYRFF